jgi:hypothetical protein
VSVTSQGTASARRPKPRTFSAVSSICAGVRAAQHLREGQGRPLADAAPGAGDDRNSVLELESVEDHGFSRIVFSS